MRQTNPRVIAEQKPLGVIDVLSAGFELVRRRPWTMLAPVLIDLLIWLLPRPTIGALLAPALDQAFGAQNLPPDAALDAQQIHDSMAHFINSLNLLGVATWGVNLIARLPSLFAPSFFLGENIDVHSPINALAYPLPIPSPALAAALVVPFFLLSLFLAAINAELIAQGVRPLVNEPRHAWLVRAALLWLRLIALAFMLGLVLFVVSFAVGLFVPAGGDVLSFVGALGIVGMFWISIYLFFVVAGMAVSTIGVSNAIRRSVLLFRLFFWPSVLLIVLTVLLGEGLGMIWRGLPDAFGDIGTFFGILANAFIGTSLFAAAMIFYQDRMNLIERLIAHARASAARPVNKTR